MMALPGPLLLGIAGAVGVLAGVAASAWWARRAAKQRRRIPKHWPLDPRTMASSSERVVWHWLGRVFFDHHIMVKMPVTRFTLPSHRENGARWYELLSGVYCTFSVCTSEGQVVGCVDVLGPRGMSRSNRQLKLSLLSQCGVGYLVVKPDRLPASKDIRAEFLGEAGETEAPGKNAAVETTAHKLRTAVHRLRDQRLGAVAREPATRSRSASAVESLLSDSEFSSGSWQQADSFIAPLVDLPAPARH